MILKGGSALIHVSHCQDFGLLAPTAQSEHVIKSVIKLIMRSYTKEIMRLIA